jgi:prepilin-type N-terminal cleavage/methylation domain-containing protein
MRKTRKGFTLVELLVVMALIAIVATMAILFFPNAATANREANAAQQLQSWLNIAKQRAQRNQRPTGVRMYIFQAPTQWNNATKYSDRDIVSFNGLAYCCIKGLSSFNNQGISPVNAAVWTPWIVASECQYIEQPDDVRGGTTSLLATVASGILPMMPPYKKVNDVISISGVDLMNGYMPQVNYKMTLPNPGNNLLPLQPPKAATDPTQIYWLVQPCPFAATGKGYYPFAPNPLGFGGDYLEVFNNGVMHQILAVLDSQTVQVWPPLVNPVQIPGTSNFRIVRGPRVVGTELLTFPDNTFIDLTTNGTYNNPLPNLTVANGVAINANTGVAETAIDAIETANSGTGFIDILFSPSGQVITPGVATSNLHLWVRSPSEDSGLLATNAFLGVPTIVSVFVRTGLVGAYPPNPNGADPYSLVK